MGCPLNMQIEEAIGMLQVNTWYGCKPPMMCVFEATVTLVARAAEWENEDTQGMLHLNYFFGCNLPVALLFLNEMLPVRLPCIMEWTSGNSRPLASMSKCQIPWFFCSSISS